MPFEQQDVEKIKCLSEQKKTNTVAEIQRQIAIDKEDIRI